MKWEILSKNAKDIEKTLLKNRNIKNEKDFFSPMHPDEINIKDLGVNLLEVKKSVDRIKKALKNKEQVVVYGDYDCDGVCAAAIMWEALNEFGLEVLPHIPDRFSEGYGINPKSVINLKNKIPNLKLIVTVDNGIVAYEAIKKAQELGVDVIVIDHHTKGTKKLKAYSIIHSTNVCGSTLAWFFVRELNYKEGLELAAIGTIADQMQLIDFNRGVVKQGLFELSNTKRPGLVSLFKDSGIKNIGTYEVNYIIAPRINAAGRLGNAIDSLRLLCTRKLEKAQELSKFLTKTNSERQKIVDTVLIHVEKDGYRDSKSKIIVIAHESYHEGVIGLVAGKITERFYKPAIVLSKGEKISKASARSIPGFNIIDQIRNLEHLIIEGGGHEMAAGFSIKNENIEEFTKEINRIANKTLTDELLEKKLNIDCIIDFSQINLELVEIIKKFEPFGNGNYPPLFASENIEISEVKKVGTTGNHLKLKLKQDESIFEAIWFNAPKDQQLKNNDNVNAAFAVEENIWNGRTSIQLKIKDILVKN